MVEFTLRSMCCLPVFQSRQEQIDVNKSLHLPEYQGHCAQPESPARSWTGHTALLKHLQPPHTDSGVASAPAAGHSNIRTETAYMLNSVHIGQRTAKFYFIFDTILHIFATRDSLSSFFHEDTRFINNRPRLGKMHYRFSRS